MSNHIPARKIEPALRMFREQGFLPRLTFATSGDVQIEAVGIFDPAKPSETLAAGFSSGVTDDAARIAAAFQEQ